MKIEELEPRFGGGASVAAPRPPYTHPLDRSLVNRLNVLVGQIDWISYLVTSILFKIK